MTTLSAQNSDSFSYPLELLWKVFLAVRQMEKLFSFSFCTFLLATLFLSGKVPLESMKTKRKETKGFVRQLIKGKGKWHSEKPDRNAYRMGRGYCLLFCKAVSGWKFSFRWVTCGDFSLPGAPRGMCWCVCFLVSSWWWSKIHMVWYFTWSFTLTIG